MKGASFGLALLMILLITNIMLYIYGIDIELMDLLVNNTGAQTAGPGTSLQPTGEITGNIVSPVGINRLISYLTVVIGGIVVAGIVSTIYGGSQWLNWAIPLAMMVMLLMTFLTPMGTIILSPVNVTAGGITCYPMRQDIVMFNITANRTELSSGLTSCMPWQAHIILVLFFALMILAAFLSFVRGAPW